MCELCHEYLLKHELLIAEGEVYRFHRILLLIQSILLNAAILPTAEFLSAFPGNFHSEFEQVYLDAVGAITEHQNFGGLGLLAGTVFKRRLILWQLFESVLEDFRLVV